MEEILKLLSSNPEMIKGFIEQYKPLVYTVAQELFNVYGDYANNKEIFKTMATSKKNKFDSLIEVGFTENQAIAFMINDDKNLEKSIKNISSSTKSTKQN